MSQKTNFEPALWALQETTTGNHNRNYAKCIIFKKTTGAIILGEFYDIAHTA